MLVLKQSTLESLHQIVRQMPADQRLQRINYQGDSYWVKRPENLSLRWRLQKGNPRRAFERERLAYQTLPQRGLPVAGLVIEGSDYLVTKNAGRPLSDVMCDPQLSLGDRTKALDAAARGLHQLHSAGVAHGRPNLKDILWDGTQITFIDLERFGKTRNLRRAKALDYVLFAFSCFATINQPLPDPDAALQTYRALDTKGISARALRFLTSLSWLGRGAETLGHRTHSREVLAFPRLLDWAKTASQE